MPVAEPSASTSKRGRSIRTQSKGFVPVITLTRKRTRVFCIYIYIYQICQYALALLTVVLILDNKLLSMNQADCRRTVVGLGGLLMYDELSLSLRTHRLILIYISRYASSRT